MSYYDIWSFLQVTATLPGGSGKFRDGSLIRPQFLPDNLRPATAEALLLVDITIVIMTLG